MIQIPGVNEHQKLLLDTIWNLPDIDAVESWILNLPLEEIQPARLLIELVQLAAMDELIQDHNDCEEIIQYLNEIFL